jgi:hypothetical protein
MQAAKAAEEAAVCEAVRQVCLRSLLLLLVTEPAIWQHSSIDSVTGNRSTQSSSTALECNTALQHRLDTCILCKLLLHAISCAHVLSCIDLCQAAIDSQLQQCVEAALKCAAVRAEADAAMTAVTQVALYAQITSQYYNTLLYPSFACIQSITKRIVRSSNNTAAECV